MRSWTVTHLSTTESEDNMTFNENDINRDRAGRFGEKTGSPAVVTLTPHEQQEAAIELLYDRYDYHENAGEFDLSHEQRREFDKLPSEVQERAKRLARQYHAVLEFDRRWAEEQGELAQDDRVFNEAVQEKFGFSAIRFMQLYLRNPAVSRRREELIESGVAPSVATRQAREEVSGGKYHRAAPVSDATAMAAFDRAEAEHERFENGF